MSTKNKTIFHDDESMYNYIKQNEEEWEMWGEEAQRVFEASNWIKYQDGKSGKKATSWEDSGRRCYGCGDLYRVIEVNELGDIYLGCNTCSVRVWNSDISPYTNEEMKELEKHSGGHPIKHLPDMLHRQISDDYISYHMRLLEERRRQSN